MLLPGRTANPRHIAATFVFEMEEMLAGTFVLSGAAKTCLIQPEGDSNPIFVPNQDAKRHFRLRKCGLGRALDIQRLEAITRHRPPVKLLPEHLLEIFKTETGHRLKITFLVFQIVQWRTGFLERLGRHCGRRRRGNRRRWGRWGWCSRGLCRRGTGKWGRRRRIGRSPWLGGDPSRSGRNLCCFRSWPGTFLSAS